jgi:hypothetical protein
VVGQAEPGGQYTRGEVNPTRDDAPDIRLVARDLDPVFCSPVS